MHKKSQCRGTAIVELAVCLPIIFMMIFASIEACNMIAIKQIVSQSAYDGALLALKPDATETQVVDNITAVLAARNVTPSNISVVGEGSTSYASLGRGDTVIVTVEANTNGNIIGPQLFGFSKTLSCFATAVKQ